MQNVNVKYLVPAPGTSQQHEVINEQLDLMVDIEDCREAFRQYDKDDSGWIPKDVSIKIVNISF